MSEQKQPEQKQPEQRQPEPNARDFKKPRAPFRVELKNKHFFGESFGVTFAGGIGQTKDPTAAHACLELGATVTDADGKEAFPKPMPEEDPTKE